MIETFVVRKNKIIWNADETTRLPQFTQDYNNYQTTSFIILETILFLFVFLVTKQIHTKL